MSQVLVAADTHQEVPGAFDVGGGKRLAVVPFDTLPQLEAEPGVALVPRPALCQFRLNEFRPVLLLILFEQYEVVEDAHHRRHRRNRRLLMDRHARRAVAMEEFEGPAALLGGRGTSGQPKDSANRQRQSQKLPHHQHAFPKAAASLPKLSVFPVPGNKHRGTGGLAHKSLPSLRY